MRPKFVNKLLEYIINDINQSVVRFNEKFGSMVVCDSSDQAKNLYSKFLENYSNSNAKNENSLSAKLILHDVDDIEERKKYIKDFKRGDVNILFVYNMLLTGFDAPVLKKLSELKSSLVFSGKFQYPLNTLGPFT